MYFDSHAHYNDERFNGDRETLLPALYEQHQVTCIMNVGYDLESSRQAVMLAQKYPFVYASAGIHPHDAESIQEGDYACIEELLREDKVKAIGETGLDYHYDNSPRQLQKQAFDNHLRLAEKWNMPVIIHERDATKDVLDLLKTYHGEGVFHCFSGSMETAKQVLDMGLYLSFAGPVTFKNARRQQEAAAYVPKDRFLIETDCPYMSPEPFRGRRNDSSFVYLMAEKIAQLKGISKEEAAALSMANAKRLFRIE